MIGAIRRCVGAVGGAGHAAALGRAPHSSRVRPGGAACPLPRRLSFARLTLLVGLCFLFDLSNPMVGAAFTFNPDDSVEGIRSRAVLAVSRIAPVSAPVDTLRRLRDLPRSLPGDLRRPDRAPAGVAFAEPRRHPGPSADPAPSPEDH